MSQAATDKHSEGAQDSRARAYWALFLMTILFGFNQLDRGIVAIVLDSIKKDMHLSDTALGLLTGLGFSILYTFAAFPLGRLADRSNRITILSVGAIFYSLFAALMGFCTNIYQLIAVRSAVAIGEASGSPSSISLLADMFPRAARARANALWSAGSYLGIFIGLAAGGWVHARYGWRVTLWATAIPGIIVAILLKLTVREPRRGGMEIAEAAATAATLRETLAFLWSQKAFRYIVLAMVSAGFTNYTLQAWVPSLLRRAHHMGDSEVGLYAGLFKGLIGLSGVLVGGFATHFYARASLERLTVFPILAMLLCPLFFGVFLYADNEAISLAALAIGSFLGPSYNGPVVAMIQGVTPAPMRAFAVTITHSSVFLVALGLGPLITGALSDLFMLRYGDASLRLALIPAAAMPFIAAYCFWQIRRTIRAEHAESTPAG